jgi:hypothetical protein
MPADVRERFSESAVSRAVLRGTAGHPLSVYPSVLGLLGALAGALFGSPVLLVGASGVFGMGLAGWLVNYFARRGSFARRYLEQAHRALEAEARIKLEALREELHELGLDQGVSQVSKFRAKLDTLEDLLRRKLDPGELTYGRYLGIAEQVYLAALDNLHEAALAVRASRAIDLDYIEGRLDEIESDGIQQVEEEEIRSLESRRALHAEQSERIEAILRQNEAAMTQLDRTSAAIAAVRTQPGQSALDLETAMAELEEMARRAPKYAAE